MFVRTLTAHCGTMGADSMPCVFIRAFATQSFGDGFLTGLLLCFQALETFPNAIVFHLAGFISSCVF